MERLSFLLLLCISYQPPSPPRQGLSSPGSVDREDGLLRDKLRQVVDGAVYVRHDPGYEEGRAVQNGGCTARPRIILVPRHTEDVAAGVRFARRGSSASRETNLADRSTVQEGGPGGECS